MCKHKNKRKKGKKTRTEKAAKFLFGDEIVIYRATITEKKKDDGKRQVHKNSESECQ